MPAAIVSVIGGADILLVGLVSLFVGSPVPNQLAPAGPRRHTRGMRRRWLVIGLGLVAYWSMVGAAVLSARQATPAPRSDAWVRLAVLTLPWSLVANQVGEGAPEQEVRAAYTAATLGGGIANGFLFVGFVLWVTRPRRPVPDAVHDYADGPDGTIPDGRVRPPAG